MHISQHDLPVKIDVPGAKARALPDVGVAEGPLAAEWFSLAAGTDIAPLLTGLPDDACASPHVGYLITGAVVVTYTDGETERCAGGDLFHWRPGHSVRVEEDAEVILFSPSHAHTVVLDHMLGVMAAAV